VSAAGFEGLHRYAGLLIEHGRRDGGPVASMLQPRDVDVLHDAWRYRFVSGEQLQELHWPNASPQARRRRLVALFRAGYLERLRPRSHRGEGSYQWSYYLGSSGHRVLQQVGLIDRRATYWQPRVFDYSRIAHDIEVNGWVLALRAELGDALLAWRGEREAGVRPSKLAAQGQLQLLDNWTPADLHGGARPVRPDALLEVRLANSKTARLFIEHDRTERPDKNIDKFHRYDNFLTWWGREGGASKGAFAVFVCATERALEAFVEVADQALTGHLQRPGAAASELVYTGRKRTLFALERDVHEGRFDAIRVPAFPPVHPSRRPGHEPERVMLPGVSAAARSEAA
jgi:hypothetical protein